MTTKYRNNGKSARACFPFFLVLEGRRTDEIYFDGVRDCDFIRKLGRSGGFRFRRTKTSCATEIAPPVLAADENSAKRLRTAPPLPPDAAFFAARAETLQRQPRWQKEKFFPAALATPINFTKE